ncbi:MAG TPA: urease accessory protein [Candidatus Krumholzibacteria bacterium]|nr:urease accessory protein [Candidatus Krumholzibacteria bacterium]
MDILSITSILGFFVGMRHALEPDHVAAVSTLVSGEGGGRRAMRVGLAWGIGHTAALLAAGGALLIVRLELPGWFAAAAELFVGILLIGLGATSIARAVRDGQRGPHRTHAHGHNEHAHAGAIPHVHVGRFVLAARPLLMGLAHGLAGTGALAALVLASMPSLASGLLYIAVFGAGSILGMTLLTGVMGATLQTVMRGARARIAFQGGAGLLSLVVGIVWIFVSMPGVLGR